VRIVVITPEESPHHVHFAGELVRRHEVVGVIHPKARRRSAGGRVRVVTRRFRRLGVIDGLLSVLAAVRNPLIGWDWISAFEDAEREYFGDAAAHREIVAPLAHHVDDVNGGPTIRLIGRLSPDAVICLGGPIYRMPLIQACGTMLNFHSGVSPLYNGTSTIMFAFANGHVQLCGGTLMTMSPVVDGGRILGHYLPAIAPHDDPATLFMKTVRGAATLCSRFLEHFLSEGRFASVPQPPALFTCTSDGWTLHHTHRVRRLLAQRTAEAHVRSEMAVEYWGLADDVAAAAELRSLVGRLLRLA
jgi:hypothetical protein